MIPGREEYPLYKLIKFNNKMKNNISACTYFIFLIRGSFVYLLVEDKKTLLEFHIQSGLVLRDIKVCPIILCLLLFFCCYLLYYCYCKC